MVARRWLVAVLALLAASNAWAEAPEAFARLEKKSQSVDSLSSFLDHYVGSCTDPEEKAACLANAKRSRAEYTGKLLYVVLDGDATRMLRAGTFDPSSREYTIQMTPFFEASGFGLTDGAPSGQDLQGRPQIRIQPIVARLPPDWMQMDMERLLRTQNIRIHLIFRPLGLWSLPGKGSKLEGVKSKFVAVRLTHARTGEDIALKLYGE